MTHMVDGHPETGSPKIMARRKINRVPTNATAQNSIPAKEAMDNGAVENATIPSREYKNSFQKFHLVSPATRSTFS